MNVNFACSQETTGSVALVGMDLEGIHSGSRVIVSRHPVLVRAGSHGA